MWKHLIIGALLFAAPVFSESLVLKSHIILSYDLVEFGGLSGIEITDNGAGFLAVSDRGTIWKGLLKRDEKSVLQEATELDFKPILTSKGLPVAKREIDAEGIDINSNGEIYISFESVTRVSHFDSWNAPANIIQSANSFAGFGFNSGPEAMCIGKNDDIMIIPERSGELEKPFPIYSYNGKKWRDDQNIRREAPYLVTGCEYSPATDRLYVLERDFAFPSFSTRIRSFALTEDGTNDEKLLWKTKYGEYGDFEGISLWSNPNGQEMLTLIADDNFSAFYSTEIVEFEIKP